jgi:hypothetical protein
MNIDNFWVYCKCKCMFVHCINVHISPYMPRSPGYSDEIGLTVTNAALTCPDQADNRLYESWCVCVCMNRWFVGSFNGGIYGVIYGGIHVYIIIYILYEYIISHPLQQQLSLLGPRAVWLWHFRYDLAFADLKKFRMRWQKDSTSRGTSAEVCGPGPREENIPSGRRSQWMNTKLGTHQNKIYKIEVPGVP